MRQRVSMARTLASEPKILLMDEPFAALDEQTRLLLGDKVLQIQQELKQTTLLITHNLTEAVQLSDRILVMTYRPGRTKRIVEIKLPRPRTSEIVSSDDFGRYVAQIWGDLREEATKGLKDDEARMRAPETSAVSARARDQAARASRSCSGSPACWRWSPDRGADPGRLDQSLHRAEADRHRDELRAHHPRREHPAAVPADLRRGAGGEPDAQRRRHLARRAAAPEPPRPARDRDLDRGGGVGAARADVSAVPGDLRPQRLDHHHDRLRLGAAAGDPQDAGGPVRHAAGADQCRAELQADALAALLENPVSRRRCRPSSSACGSA